MAAGLAIQLRRFGHVVGVISMQDRAGTAMEAALDAEGVPTWFLGKRLGPDLRMVPRIARAFREFRPDVLHSHMYALKYALPALALRRRCRAVHTFHNVAERESDAATRRVHALAFRVGVVPVAIGDAVAESARRVYGRAPRHTIPNGIPVAAYAERPGTREEVRRGLAIPLDAPVFICVGRLDPQKNHEALLRAFFTVPSRDAHLLVVGSGALRAGLERLAVELGVAERVHFLGVRSDVPRLLSAADVFVLASSWEGNPLAVMEAMAARKPVVATAVGCVPELVPEPAGELVPPGDERVLASAMARFARDPLLAREKGAAAERIARDRFDEVVMARAYERLYTEIA